MIHLWIQLYQVALESRPSSDINLLISLVNLYYGMQLNNNDDVPPPSPPPIDPNDAPGAVVPNDDDAPLLLFFFFLPVCLQWTMTAWEEQGRGRLKQSCGRQLHCPPHCMSHGHPPHWRHSPLQSHVPQNAVARSALSLPHHYALAVVGEGNEGGRAVGSLLFFLARCERGEFTLSDNCYILCKESSSPEFWNLCQWYFFYVRINNILQTRRINTKRQFFYRFWTMQDENQSGMVYQ